MLGSIWCVYAFPCKLDLRFGVRFRMRGDDEYDKEPWLNAHTSPDLLLERQTEAANTSPEMVCQQTCLQMSQDEYSIVNDTECEFVLGARSGADA